MTRAYLALGTNLGDKPLNLERAIALIAERVGAVSAISSLYESEPWGFDSDNSFLNMAIAVDTALEPEKLLSATQQIEKEMGRTRKSGSSHAYQDRIIDIDIILYGDITYKSDNLEIPHPLYKQRPFVMIPLQEILSLD
jgi:2-amino-4-hydroxy-6-hydroxymethyldihydropteridine pyrophosphokinase